LAHKNWHVLLVSVKSNRMKLIVCESCDAEFRIKHDMSGRLYKVEFCPFCGEELNEELEDELDYDEEYEDE